MVLKSAQLKESSYTQKAFSTDFLSHGKKAPATVQVSPNWSTSRAASKHGILKLPLSSQEIWRPKSICVLGVECVVSSLQTLLGVSICHLTGTLPLFPVFSLSFQCGLMKPQRILLLVSAILSKDWANWDCLSFYVLLKLERFGYVKHNKDLETFLPLLRDKIDTLMYIN